MDNKTVRIFLACTLGSIAGLAVAISTPHIIWWLGALAGATAGGFVYAFREIAHYAPVAARSSWHALSYIPMACSAIASFCKSLKNADALKKWQAISWATLFVTFLTWIGGYSILLRLNEPGEPWAPIEIIGGMLLFLIAYFTMGSHSLTSAPMSKGVTVASAKRGAFFASPVGPPVWILMKVPAAIRFLTIGIYETGKFLFGFTKTLFIYVHSKELMLCAVDSGFGVAISYPLFVMALGLSFGPTLLLGGLIGGVLGVVNYEIVSKRVLHLAPARKS